MISPCSDCPNRQLCNDRLWACSDYVHNGVRGANPSRHYYLELENKNIDKANRRIEELLSNGKSTAAIAEYIVRSIDKACIQELSFPECIKAELMAYLWEYFPSDRIDLLDFIGDGR